MKYILEILWLLLLCTFSANSSASDTSKTFLSQINCSNSGTYGNNNITLEWDNVNSSESTFYCSLTMNPYDDARFIRFAFRERSFFLRYFFQERKLFSSRKESFFRIENELCLTEIVGENMSSVRIYPSPNGTDISEKQLRDLFEGELYADFMEFVEFTQNAESFLEMFEKYPVLYSADGISTNMFLMPKARELAIFAGTRKGKKDATIYFSPWEQKDYLFWKILFIDGRLVVIEYSSAENLFWVDENGDGISEFCLRKQRGIWLKFPCLKQSIPNREIGI